MRGDDPLTAGRRTTVGVEALVLTTFGGRVLDDLQKRPWGASDGQVIDRYGLRWLIGFEGDGTG